MCRAAAPPGPRSSVGRSAASNTFHATRCYAQHEARGGRPPPPPSLVRVCHLESERGAGMLWTPLVAALALSPPHTVSRSLVTSRADHTLQRRCCSRGAVALAAESPPPPEVIEAEANATPNRKYRLLGAGVGLALASSSGVLSAAVLAGQPDAISLRDLVLFDNPILSLLLDVVIGSTCAWAIQQELKTRDENIQRIWEEVQRRRAGGAKSGANRSQRRAKKAVDSRPVQFTGGGGFAPPPLPPPAPAVASPPPAAPTPPAATDAQGGGVLGGVKAFFEEANELGRAQAFALNAQLEDAGVIAPISSQPDALSSADALPDVRPASTPATQGAGRAAPDAAETSGTRSAPSPKRKAKGGSKKKGARKGKSKKR